MYHEEAIAWLRLIRSENVGPITFYKLLEQYGTAQAALNALPELAKNGGKKKIKICSLQKAKDEIAQHEQNDAKLLLSKDDGYPPLLKQLEDAPPILSVKGHCSLLKKRSVALVGARNASINGCNFARKLAQDLGSGGICVVSGLARGIDGAAHKGALETGTIAVQGGGIDVVYPQEHQKLYDEMVERGCLVSEPAIGTTPQARHFPRRNRIISGMSRAIVVVEAAPKSGSLITARLALEQGRDVFAVPGFPTEARAGGTNQLIREGAILLESAQDIFQQLNLLKNTSLNERKIEYKQTLNVVIPSVKERVEAKRKIQESLSISAVCVDEIIRQCQISASIVQMILLELELAGQIERHPGNRVSIIV